MNLLATIDGSGSSLLILPHAAALVNAAGGKLIVLRVFEPGDTDAAAPSEVRAAMEEGLREVLEPLPVDAEPMVITSTGGERIADLIASAVDSTGAELVAISTRGRGAVRRAAFVSVASEVVRNPSVPVMAAGQSVGPPHRDRTERLLVATEGAESSDAIANGLRPLLADWSPDLTLLEVHVPVISEWTDVEQREAAKREVHALAGRFPEDLVAAELVLEPSGFTTPAATIAKAATEFGVDAIVLATRARGAMGQLFLGSVAQDVVRKATVPCILVRRA